jgi:DNA-binding response OmpR family regulator
MHFIIPKLANNRILLVEDEEDLLDLFYEALKVNGFSIDKFADPVAAYLEFRKNPEKYRVVVSDVKMSGMNGFELAREIGKLNPDVSIILMSAFELDSFESGLKEMSLSAVLKKPLHLQELVNRVQECYQSMISQTTELN